MFDEKDKEILLEVANMLAIAIFDIGKNIPMGTDFNNDIAIVEGSENVERGLNSIASAIDRFTEAYLNK